MKHTFLLLIIAVLLASCSSTKSIPYARTGMVKSVNQDRQTITVTSESRAENLGKASYYAEINAFENLLFKGIPNSNQEKPLVRNEGSSVSKHKAYYRQLLDNRGYERFIMSSLPNQKYRDGGVHTVVQQIQIDLHALRKDLEDNKIIGSFGL